MKGEGVRREMILMVGRAKQKYERSVAARIYGPVLNSLGEENSTNETLSLIGDSLLTRMEHSSVETLQTESIPINNRHSSH